ncbi:hypothetical protein GE09DRAFT_189205 [Coniochaeta sp. 2T2.1]|nr:hypothetical protein GE09DRAFT_189205 [Coniochaeta sp. 2T2.1]
MAVHCTLPARQHVACNVDGWMASAILSLLSLACFTISATPGRTIKDMHVPIQIWVRRPLSEGADYVQEPSFLPRA